MFKKLLLLGIAIALTIIATLFQQMTRPDKPLAITTEINDTAVTIELPTFTETDNEAKLKGCNINIYTSKSSSSYTGSLYFKQFNINEKWRQVKLISMQDNFVSILPYYKPVKKIEYYLELNSNGKQYFVAKDKPAVVRFQGEVPKVVNWPYVVLMFTTLIFVLFAALMAWYSPASYKKYFHFSFYTYTAAMVFASIIYALSMRHWLLMISPYNDLTYYKRLIVFVVFLLAYRAEKKKTKIVYPIIVASVMLLYYFLPQSLFF